MSDVYVSRPITPLSDAQAASFNRYIEGDTFLAEEYPERERSDYSFPRTSGPPPPSRIQTPASQPSSIRSPLSAQWPGRISIPSASPLPVSPFMGFPDPTLHLPLNGISPPSAQTSITFRRYDEFFFEDANIVLVSDENVAFGVHRGVMKRLSTVFSHMFQDVHETQDMEMFQGLPFVRLSDTTDDLLTFFQVIYDQRTIESIEAPHKRLLTFCDKYEINSVLRKILAYLLHSFPDTLEAWKLTQDKRKTEEAIIIAVAAFKMDMKIFLPSCLYTIMIDSNHKEIAVENLPKDLLVKYYRGLVEFSAYTTEFYCNTLCGRVTPPKGCNKAKCKELWVEFRSRVRTQYLDQSDHIRGPNPLRYLHDLSELALSFSMNHHLYCDRCRTALPGVFECAEKEVWNSLPTTFGIADGWGTLKREYL